MYNYNKLFIGVPLNQFEKRPKESLEIIKELSGMVSEDLSFKNIDKYKGSEKINLFLKNTKDFIDGKTNEEFYDLINTYKLDFHIDYNCSLDFPMIFGFYVDNLFPIESFMITRFNIENLDKINLLKDRFSRLAYYLFGDDNWNKLNKDNLMGVFFNCHSS